MTEIPEDIQREWLSVVRRLQSVSKTQGLACVSITVLVDDSGKPITWLEPRVKKIEPRSAAQALLNLISENKDL